MTGVQTCALPISLLGRGHLGDGVIDFGPISAAVTAAGYQGYVEVEIFNADVWDAPADQTAATVRQRFAATLGSDDRGLAVHQGENPPAGQQIEILIPVRVPEIASFAADILLVEPDGPQHLHKRGIDMVGVQFVLSAFLFSDPMYEIFGHVVTHSEQAITGSASPPPS